MSQMRYGTAERISFEKAIAGIRLRETVLFNGEVGLNGPFCTECEKSIRPGEVFSDYDDGMTFLYCEGCYEDLWSWPDWDEVDAEWKQIELEEHPLNQLPSRSGHRIDAFDRPENSRRERKLDMWHGPRIRSDRSRRRSRAKKPWRRVQQSVERNKCTIDPQLDLGILPTEIRLEIEAEERLRALEDSCDFDWSDPHPDDDPTIFDVWDYQDDPYLYGSYDDLYRLSDEDMQEVVWAGHHPEACECHDCQVRRHEDLL